MEKEKRRIKERTETEPLELEIREEGDGLTLTGLAVPYRKWSEKLGWFREKIHPGASTKTLKESKDIASLFNHNSDKILGRTSAGTLTLMERDGGVYYQVPLGSQSYVTDLVETHKRGDIQGNSFAFSVPEGKEKWTEQGEEVTRDVYEIQLYEVGPQVFPAYSQTSLKIRSIFGVDEDAFDFRLLAKSQFFAIKGLTLPESDTENLLEQFRTILSVVPNTQKANLRFLTGFVEDVSRGIEFTENDHEQVNQVIEMLRSTISEPGNHSDADDEPDNHSFDVIKSNMRARKLRILELTI